MNNIDIKRRVLVFGTRYDDGALELVVKLQNAVQSRGLGHKVEIVEAHAWEEIGGGDLVLLGQHMRELVWPPYWSTRPVTPETEKQVADLCCQTGAKMCCFKKTDGEYRFRRCQYI